MHIMNQGEGGGPAGCRTPPWIRLSCTLFTCLLVPVYWVQYGPANFLWFSDIALLGTVAALWLGSRLLASMMALAALLPEAGWNIDFFTRLILGADAMGMDGTRYMFDPSIPVLVRALSLFHMFLPVLLFWLVRRLGYDSRALAYQTLLAWIILPASYLFTDPAHNINFVLGVGSSAPRTDMTELAYLVLLMLILPLCIYLPTHFALTRIAGKGGDEERDNPPDPAKLESKTRHE